ncbi:hypothetical protein C6A86_025700 [Mycobacterium sp. ITM-2016-00316]|uniref:hypothetical protein n=1 Tax=Mycobacterium sp. ITM-2016-00316 TaxID=2099695 RepID=UPI000CFA2450|nr:hypothetical protein [Mycobacterium sp. ITM-2016-00316]WNG81529.1 hypothetical protein C6A86_025700 [Mycobacterium sp. ITM-2016-00316]
MTTPLTYLALVAVLLAPFALTWALSRIARRTGILRLSLDQFRPAAPFVGRLVSSDNSLDRDGLRAAHDLDAIRTRFEQQPTWPASSASGERR